MHSHYDGDAFRIFEYSRTSTQFDFRLSWPPFKQATMKDIITRSLHSKGCAYAIVQKRVAYCTDIYL